MSIKTRTEPPDMLSYTCRAALFFTADYLID